MMNMLIAMVMMLPVRTVIEKSNDNCLS